MAFRSTIGPAPGIGTRYRSILWFGLIAAAGAMAAPQPPAEIPADWFRPAIPLTEGDGTGGLVIDPSQRQTSRRFYQSVFTASEHLDIGWTGDLTGCAPGTPSPDYQDATILRVNWFRAMAGVPADVVLDGAFSDKAQQAALMIAANDQLSHYPPTSWSCYTPEGAEAARNSNLSLGNAGPDAVFSQMRDDGTNNASVAHRRWILHPQTQRMGVGSLPSTPDSRAANALWVFDDNLRAARPPVRDGFIAWPPPGYVPYQSVFARWSFSYDDADFSAAAVTMTRNDSPIAVTLEPLSLGAGENTLVWLPAPYRQGEAWTRPTTDETYRVTVSDVLLAGVSRDFTYEVTVFDPSEKGSDEAPQSLTGPDGLWAGFTASFAFSPVPAADGYQWRAATATDYTTIADAESGSGDWRAVTSSGYQVVSADRPASGFASFHLAHPQPMVDQILTLERSLLPAADAQLWFSSWLGWATEQQVTTIEVSEDGGQSWEAIWERSGVHQPVTESFDTIAVPLGDYADRSIDLRFNYRHLGGTYYPQTTAEAGWFIDDIEFTGVAVLHPQSARDADRETGFTYTPSAEGTVLLQVRPLLFGGYPSEWSLVKPVEVQAGDCSTRAMTLESLIFDGGSRAYRSEIGLDVRGEVQVGTGAFLWLAAPRIQFRPGFRVEAGGRLQAAAQPVSCSARTTAW